MPPVLIAGIARVAQKADLETLLSRCDGLQIDRIRLFTKEPSAGRPGGERTYLVPFHGSPIASETDGTSVPGMGRAPGLKPYVPDASENHLEGVGIPHEAANYYNAAIDQGRSVVIYATNTEAAASAAEQFRACGLVKIRRFLLAEAFEAAL